MSEETIKQSGHLGEGLYSILSTALSKHDEVWQDAEKARQLRSRLIEILNVPLRVRLRVRFACGLADSLFEHPEISHATAPLSKMPKIYCIKLGFSAVSTDVRFVADKTNAGETTR